MRRQGADRTSLIDGYHQSTTDRAAAAAPPLGRFRSFAELLGLAGLAITQPLLDVLGRAPDLFLLRNATRADAIVLAVAIALVPAVVLWSLEQVVGLARPTARLPVHRALVFGLLVLLGLVTGKRLLDAGGPVLVLVVAGGAAGAAFVLYLRSSVAREVVAFCGLAPLLYVGAFLLTSPVADVISGQEVEAADIGVVREPRSIVFLQFDEWPLRSLIDGDGRIDPQLFPNLAALADDATWFRNATTVSTGTSTAVPAIVTGRRPTHSTAPVASEYPESLFTLLAGRFDLDVVETVTRVCPVNLCAGDLVDHPGRASEPAPAAPTRPTSDVGDLVGDAARTWRQMVDPFAEAVTPEATLADAVEPTDTMQAALEDARGEDTPTTNEWGLAPGFSFLNLRSTDQLIDSIERNERPTLHYVHVLLPHQPYRLLPSGQAYDDADAMIARGELLGAGDPIRDAQPAAAAVLQQRFILQAGYADALLGEVMTRLRRTGLYDDSIVVVVADHGYGLEPGGLIRHPRPEQTDLFPDVLYPPLLIKAPGLDAGAVSDADAETIDILPTLADLLGIDIPWEVDGVSLLGEGHPDDRRTFVIDDGEAGYFEEVDFRSDDYREEVLARNVDTLFRADNPRYRLYDITAAGELVGRRVDQVRVGPRSGWGAVLDEPEKWEAVEPTSGFLPTRLLGHLEGPEDGSPPLVAVALDGTIAAVVEPFRTEDERYRIDAMLVPELVHDGQVDVRLFEVAGDEAARLLQPIVRTSGP